MDSRLFGNHTTSPYFLIFMYLQVNNTAAMVFPKTGGNFMENYVEKRLTTIHNTSEQSVKNYKQKVITFFVGLFIIVTLPYIHLGKFLYIVFMLTYRQIV